MRPPGDWADSEDHDFLNELVGKRITAVETGESANDDDEVGPWLRLSFSDGRVFEVIAETVMGEVMLTVQDR